MRLTVVAAASWCTTLVIHVVGRNGLISEVEERAVSFRFHTGGLREYRGLFDLQRRGRGGVIRWSVRRKKSKSYLLLKRN